MKKSVLTVVKRPDKHSFLLFKIYNSNAGFAFAKGAETVGFDVAAFFEFVMNGGPEFSGSPAVNDGDLI